MRTISGKKSVLELMPEILHDESKHTSGIPQELYFPESSVDLQKILNEAYCKALPVTFIGSQTGTTGGAVPLEDSVAVSFSAMNKINAIRWEGNYPVLYCDPGVTLSSISAFLKSPQKWAYHVPGSELLQNRSFTYLPDPTETTAQLGGTVATNASGARSFRFGPTRAFVEYLSCVLSNGEILKIKRGKYLFQNNSLQVFTDQNSCITIPSPVYLCPTVKNASGYFSKPNMDLIDLLVGSEGTLAAVSEIGIKLLPSFHIISGMSFFKDNKSAFDFADFLRSDNQIVSIEFFDENSLTFVTDNSNRLSEQFPGYPSGKHTAVFWEFMENQPDSFESRIDLWENQLSQCDSSFEHTWSGFEKSERERLRRFRHAIPELINATIANNKIKFPSIRKIGTDTAVPDNVFRPVYNEYISRIKERSLKYASFGHLGDYHLHINIIPYTDSELQSALEVYKEIMKITINNGGTISAEHGIGKLKREYFYQMYDSDAISQMRAVKIAFDPKGILNSGNLF